MGTLQAAKRTSKVLITAFKKHVLNIKDEEKVVGPEELAELLWGPGRLANLRQELRQLRPPLLLLGT